MNETTSKMPCEASPQANADAYVLVGERLSGDGVLRLRHVRRANTSRLVGILPSRGNRCEHVNGSIRGPAEPWKWLIEERSDEARRQETNPSTLTPLLQSA